MRVYSLGPAGGAGAAGGGSGGVQAGALAAGAAGFSGSAWEAKVWVQTPGSAPRGAGTGAAGIEGGAVPGSSSIRIRRVMPTLPADGALSSGGSGKFAGANGSRPDSTGLAAWGVVP